MNCPGLDVFKLIRFSADVDDVVDGDVSTVLKYIGKEFSFFEEVDSGTIHSSEAVYTEYPDPRRDEWSAVREVLWKIPLATFEELTGKSRRRLIDARSGRREPHPATRALLASVARRLGLIR
jgi:hypothetical protein